MKNPGFLWLLLLAQLVSCQFSVERTPTVLNKEHRIEIDDCGISYNGQPLKFGETLEKWEKLLGKSRRLEYGHIWDQMGLSVYLDYDDREKVEHIKLPIKGFRVFFQNAKDFRPLYYQSSDNEFYPKKTFKDAISINGALLSRGMGYSEIQDRLDETGASGKLEINSKVRRGTDPYIDDGIPGTYTRPPLTFCDNRKYVYNFHLSRIEPIEDEEVFWETLEDYEKGNAIEVLEIYEMSKRGYFSHGKRKYQKGKKDNDKELQNQGIALLIRAVEKGSEEAKIFLKEQNLHE